MAGLDPNQYVNTMKFSATHLLQMHMDSPSFISTWDKFVLSVNKWLTRRGYKEYNKVDLANMRGGLDSATDKILTDLGHKGCLVADLIGILKDAEMHDILQSEEFKLRPDQGTQSKAGNRKRPPSAQGASQSKKPHGRPSGTTDIPGAQNRQQAGASGENYPDGLEMPQLPGGKPQFAIITANETEKNVVKRYLKLKPLCGRVYAELMGYDWKHDPFLKEMKVDITTHDPVDIYDVFTIGEVMGVHVNCTRIGPGGAQATTSDLLRKASEEKWPLKAIFVVGCCGVSMSDAKKMQKNWRGTVLLSDQMEDYLDAGKAIKTGLQPKPRTYNLCGIWVDWLSEESICQPDVVEESQRDIPVEKVDKYLSGPLVIKSEEDGNNYRGNCQMAGIEMEGARVYTTVNGSVLKDMTKVAVVKGISDYAGSDKNEPAKSVVFGKETAEEIDDKARQEIATLHAITLVTRCVASNAKRF